MLNSANKSIDLEQMTFVADWGKDDDAGSPLFNAVVAAARRGVKVRVLANDESVFDHPSSGPREHKNETAVDMLNQLARSEKLALEARVADIKKMGVNYIHNKGALIDGERTLVSSINWNQNSVENNREAAVLVTSPEVHKHYKRLFDNDWQRSAPEDRHYGVAIDTVQCPETMHVRVRIGALRLPDPDDSSFASLNRSTIEADFERFPGGRGCVLAEVPIRTTNQTRFIQIRNRAGGERNVALEGYTPAGKLYSIRTQIAANTDLEGEFRATVYDGSGAARQKLGPATAEFSALEER
jgi:phosphatidylserine/phosphatidylglycerophosphate/cardiolipin synthase-like enzyme